MTKIEQPNRVWALIIPKEDKMVVVGVYLTEHAAKWQKYLMELHRDYDGTIHIHPIGIPNINIEGQT